MNSSIKDDKFFPEYLVSDSVKSQKELDDVLSKYSNLSRSFVWMSVCQPQMRNVYESEWLNVKKYLDKDFVKTLHTIEDEFVPRSWEFHLAVALIKHKLPLKEKTWERGPDFCIETKNGKKIWVEAVTCTLGKEDPVESRPDLKPGQIYSSGGNIEDSHRPRALRIMNAIDSKLKKYKNYLKDGIVSKNDCLIIAVNGQLIGHYSEPNMLFKYTIFGQGPDVLIKVPGQDKLQGGFYKPIPVIIKNTKDKKEEIPPHFMEMDEFSMISAVVYCGYAITTAQYNGYEIGDDFLFAYHSNPINSIPIKLFKFGRGIRKDILKGTISDVVQN